MLTDGDGDGDGDADVAKLGEGETEVGGRETESCRTSDCIFRT